MPQTNLYDRTGKNVGSVELSDELFAAPVNAAVLHQVVTAQLAGRRTGTHDTKTRGEVRGGGRSRTARRAPAAPARAPISAPHYRGGGVVFGPHPRSYEQRLPRKMKRLALRGALTAKFGDEAIKVIDTFGLEAIRTKELVGVLGALEATGRVLVVAPGARREARALGAQPADRRGHPGRLAQRGRPAQRGRRPHRAAGAGADAGGLRMSVADRPRDHPAPGHQREVDRRVGSRQVHLRRPRRRQQDPDQGRRRGALQEGERDRRGGQRPDHEGQGEAPRQAPRAGSSATPRPGARPS